MSNQSTPGRAKLEWLLEAVKFSISVTLYVLGDRIYVAVTGDQKPGGLAGEVTSTLIIAILSCLVAVAILQFALGRPCLVISWSLDAWDNPSRHPVIDLVSTTDRGVKLEVSYRGGSMLSGLVALCAKGSEVECKISLAPPNRIQYTAQVVFPEASVSGHGVLFKLPGLRKGPPYGCEISLGRTTVSQVPIPLECQVDVASSSTWRHVIYRFIKVESNVDGFSVRST